MPKSTITWNGVSSDTLNITVERFPHIIRAARKFEQVSVPGRNGDLFFFQDAWNNYEQEYDIFAGTGTRGNVARTFNDIASWLQPESASPTVDDYINLTLNGYHRLVDSYETTAIRLAAVVDGMDTANAWNRFGQATLRFNCRPERFTNNAFTAVTKTAASANITNPTDRYAKPMIKVYGSGNGTLNVNGYIITITGMSDYLYIDCESQNCFRLLAENRNNLITLTSGFPKLAPGGNTITRTGGITKYDIWPRWWKL